MNHIVEKLEELIGNLGIEILEKWNDKLTYIFVLRNKEKVYVINTSRYVHYFRRDYCLKLFQLTEHIPFNSVKVNCGEDFMFSYVHSITYSEKCKIRYDKYFNINGIIQLLKS